MQKYGFVYIWFDKRRKMYYVGCHWGSETDGYICSSNRMRDAYRRRPTDFRRKILKTNISSIEETFNQEQYYFGMIKQEEIGKRYYNLHVLPREHWSKCEQSRKSVGEKISQSPFRNQRISNALRDRQFTAEHKQKIKQAKTGKKLTEEHKNKISYGGKGRQFTQESKKKISQALRGLKRGPMSEEQKELRRKPKSEETKQKISASMKNRINRQKVS